jgi:hypothetical protein
MSLVVVVASLSLLVMHSLPMPESGAPMRGSLQMLTEPHAAHSSSPHAMTLQDGSRVESSRPQMPAHLHELLGCLWLAAVALALLALRGSSRVRGVHLDPFAVSRNMLATGQRAPPSSVRLSLVGVSRR